MMDKLDPNFWPTRGRRSSTSSEESPPPFWAHRGRAVEELESVLAERGLQSEEAPVPPFWAHRGREIICPDLMTSSLIQGTLKNPLSVEEPRWVMFNRRDADDAGPEDSFWISQDTGPLSLPRREHEFWVSRGKKERSQKKDALRALTVPAEDFYPSRGKRALPSQE